MIFADFQPTGFGAIRFSTYAQTEPLVVFKNGEVLPIEIQGRSSYADAKIVEGDTITIASGHESAVIAYDRSIPVVELQYASHPYITSGNLAIELRSNGLSMKDIVKEAMERDLLLDHVA